ncbi:zinc ribbon domain-containing protein [Halopenitus persicus]|uniref:zinc ribbon domain-containing protein n=1 Tax=Halopenitus persicus TaxID=1048396 RepID=UPI000BBB6465|nr:zinc ribbon domain-containing protein [Halopenitus persicus]
MSADRDVANDLAADGGSAPDVDAVGIETAAIRLPEYRLSSEAIAEAWGTSHAPGVERKAVAGADEDALTMAVAAADRVLAGDADGTTGGGAASSDTVDPDRVDLVVTATTTPPMEEGEFTPRLVRALGLPTDVATATLGGSTAAGGEALARGLEAAASRTALVVVADCPAGDPAETDHPMGAGAAAFVLSSDPAVSVGEPAWHVEEYPGIRHRERGAETVDTLDITTYQRTAIRESITAATEALADDGGPLAGPGLEAVDAAAVHQPNGSLPYRATGDLPFDPEAVQAGTVADRIGDAGAATVPIGLLAAVADANGEADGADPDGDRRSVAAVFGGGTAVSMACRGTVSVAGVEELDAGESITYDEYLRKRGTIVDGEVAGGGAHVSLPNWQGSLDQRYRLVAGRCPECGGVTFPPTGACRECHERVTFEEFEAPRTGTVRAVTVIGQGGAPPEFAGHQQRDGAYGVAIVDLGEGDDEITLPGQLTDADPTAVEVGDAVTATVRRIYEQEGVPRYGVKFVPEADAE